MVPAHRTVPRKSCSIIIVEVGAKHLRSIKSIHATSPDATSATMRSHIIGIIKRSESHNTHIASESSTHKTLRISVFGAICKVGISKHTTVHTLLQTKVKHRLLITVVNASNLCKVAFLVVSLNLVNNVCWQILHGSLGIAHHKLLAIYLNLLNFLAINRYLAIVIYLGTRQTLHKFLNC